MRPTTRIVAAGVVGLCTIALTGCLSAMIPDAVATSTAAPTPDQTGDGSWAGTDLTFDAGALLASGTYIEWADGMIASDDYAVDSPDDGNGGWSYTHLATQCIASFWQGTITDFDLTGGDEYLSDQVLAQDFGEQAADITPYAGDVQLALLSGADVDMRVVTGADDTTSYVVVARGFAALGVALYFSLDCPAGQDAETVFGEVSDDVSVSVTPPS